MTESGKIVVATVLSVLAHVSLFTVLALVPGRALVPEDPAQAVDDRPLEVTIQAAPANPEPAPQPATPEPIPETAAGEAIRTQIDPENLRKTDDAPENAKAIAAHNSKATPQQAATPISTPSATQDGLPLSAAKPTPTPGEIGIDALGNYGKAVGNAIGIRWTYHCKHQRPPLPPGEVVHGQFVLDAGGQTSEITILTGTANPAVTACARQSVQEAKIPPIPPDRLAQLPGGRMRITFSLSTYSLQ